MLQIANIKFKHRLGLLAGLGLVASMGVVLLSPGKSHAAECTASSPYSCVSVMFGDLSGKTTATPGATSKSKIYFTMPVSITMNMVQGYSVTISDSNGGKLKSSGSSEIPSVTSATSWSQFDDLARAWGFRYTEGKYDDGIKDFEPVQTTTISGKTAPRGLSSADYTLGFGVIVDGNTAAGEYSDVMTVSVVAQPRDITIFDIKNMQDMTPDICAATTTPSASATGTDTDGSHMGDTNYVPEVTLRDTRGGGIDGSGNYLVRKLADGNCWMSQNLELDILGEGQKVTNYATYNAAENRFIGTQATKGLVFTANDTDLHSTSVWTPEYFKKAYVDTGMAPDAKVYTTMANTAEEDKEEYKWEKYSNDGVRSYSYDASNDAWSYSVIKEIGNNSKVSTFEDSASGEPYERRGNLYNFAAATLGSTFKLDEAQFEDHKPIQAEDSICPRGWQLPVGGNDSDLTVQIPTPFDPKSEVPTNKSFVRLLRVYGFTNLSNVSITNYNHMPEWPLQFLPTGHYAALEGRVMSRILHGLWMLGTSVSVNSGGYMANWGSGTNRLIPNNSGDKGGGHAIRCVAR